MRMARTQDTTVCVLAALFAFLLLLCTRPSEGLRPYRADTPPRPRAHRFPHQPLHKHELLISSRTHDESSPYQYETRFYSQTLDHFSFRPASFQTFQQRYLLNTQHWAGTKRQAPIFLYCGNEGDIVWFAENTGFMWELAPRLGAMLVFPEHRYYGKSIPDIALTNQTADTLAYLTSEQALADFATLITDLKKNFSAESSPVVAFGGSYGGMLAAWFRLKYPHVVIGALSASAPILQFDDIVPWDSFYRIVSQDFKRESTSCFETIRSSWEALTAAAAQPGGLETLKKKFHICSNVTPDIEGFFSEAWVYLPMVDYPIPANFLMPLPAYPIRQVCNAIDNMPEGTDILTRIFAGASIYYNSTGEVECFDTSGDPHGMALWGWQACTEMMMPMSSNASNSMFPPSAYDLEAAVNSCKSYYGVSPRPHWITQEFGGHDINTVLKHFASNIIFSNGLLDPWSGGGVLQSISESVVALVTPEGAHHLDLRSSTKDDPAWLIEQRSEETKHIGRWLSQYYADWRATH